MATTEHEFSAPDPSIYTQLWRTSDFWHDLKRHPLNDFMSGVDAMMMQQVKFWESRPAMIQVCVAKGITVNDFLREETIEARLAFDEVDRNKHMLVSGLKNKDRIIEEKAVDWVHELIDVQVYALIYAGILGQNSAAWRDGSYDVEKMVIMAETALNGNIRLLELLGLVRDGRVDKQLLAEQVIEEKNGGNHLPPFYLPVPSGTSRYTTIDVYDAGRSANKRVREASKKLLAPTPGVMSDELFPRKAGARNSNQYANRAFGMTRRVGLYASLNGRVEKSMQKRVEDPLRQIFLAEMRGYLTDYTDLLRQDGFADPIHYVVDYVARYMPQYTKFMLENVPDTLAIVDRI